MKPDHHPPHPLLILDMQVHFLLFLPLPSPDPGEMCGIRFSLKTSVNQRCNNEYDTTDLEIIKRRGKIYFYL